MTRPIAAIYGYEPARPGEYAQAFVVGQETHSMATGTRRKITSIAQRVENYGDHGIAWFDVYCEGDNGPSFSMAERATAEIHYGTEE